MTGRPRGRYLLPWALAAGLALGGCGADAPRADESTPRGAAKPAYGDTFVEVLLGNISGLIPNIVNDAASHEVGGMIYNGLITTDGDLNIVGNLARSWSFSRDCLDLSFKLHPNVKWHDGRPFTADDVLFTYATMIHPKTPTSAKDDFLAIETVEAVDPYTVSVRYKRPYARALMSWGVAMLPRHLLEPYVREGKLREAPQNWQRPVGTGPYRFSEMQAGEKVVLVANQEYFAGRPYLSRVVFRIIPSQATIFLELKAKGLDAAGISSGLTALQYSRQTDYPVFRRAYHKYRYPSSRYTYLGLNLKDPRFADRRVRQAFAHAINKQELIDGVALGLAGEATGPYKPGTWAHNPRVRTYPYDLARARQLLAEAGWRSKNADGLLTKNGHPFTFELLTNQGNEERKKIAEIIQASLKELGIGVDIRVLEWAAFLKEHVRKRRFDAVVLGWALGVDPDQYAIWHSTKNGPDDLNHVSYASPEADELLEKGRTSCVREERVKYYHRLQEVLAEDQPYVFLYFRDSLPVVSSRVYGIVPKPNGIGYNFPEWYVPRHLHRYTAG